MGWCWPVPRRTTRSTRSKPVARDLDDGAVAWVSQRRGPVSADVPTPAFYDGDFFVLSDLRKALSRVEPSTGKVKWTVETPGRAKYEASPLAADGKIYLINFDGTVVIYNAADGKMLEEISMDAPQDGEMVRASVAAAHGQLFIRTTRKLYCVGLHVRRKWRTEDGTLARKGVWGCSSRCRVAC
jgi:outer membrane protein assembly factor BamB